MKNTGVYATEEEFEALKRLVSGGWKPGDMMIVFSIAEGIERDRKTVEAKEACHAVALKHGLPDIEGYYGVSNEREFVHF